ncbi:MAG TPA: hypothetical protein VGL75_08780 [Acidothermaceae bacterium]|jgi:hypothetical protein
MTKYDGLARLLRDLSGPRTRLTFETIATAVPGGLPPSAYRRTAWWSNEAQGSHVQARAWMDAGWRVEELDLADRSVTFIRSRSS